MTLTENFAPLLSKLGLAMKVESVTTTERVYVFTDSKDGRRVLEGVKDALNAAEDDTVAWWGDPPPAIDHHPGEWLNIDVGGSEADNRRSRTEP